MPVKNGHDSKGSFYRWGGHGKKYYYTRGNGISRDRAQDRALAQARAAHANGYHESSIIHLREVSDD